MTFSPETITILCGVTCALTWGASDFSGGFATKRGNVYTVIFSAQTLGAVLTIIGALLFSGAVPAFSDMVWGAMGGFCGALGLICLYQGLAVGRMGIVAPLSAVGTASVPLAVAMLSHGLPRAVQLIGFALALAAIWLLSASGHGGKAKMRELVYAGFAGLGFGLFFVFFEKGSQVSILWPLVAAKLVGVSLMAMLMFIRREPLLPNRDQILAVGLAGVLDTGGNVFFALAAHYGRLDVAAVLGSMYPASTVMLSRWILKEHLQRNQWIGVGAALTALVLIAL